MVGFYEARTYQQDSAGSDGPPLRGGADVEALGSTAGQERRVGDAVGGVGIWRRLAFGFYAYFGLLDFENWKGM